MSQSSSVSQSQNNNDLAEPFSRIFVDRAEAAWAFDLLRETARRLCVTDPYDPRVAVTISERSGRLFLRLNFGGWLVLGFRGPGRESPRVDMALLASRVSWDERFTSLASDRKEGEPEVRSYELPVEMVRPMTADLQQAHQATLDFIADKFQSWKKAAHWKQHNPEIIEALFDLERRDRLFAGGLNEPELRYERHFTAFSRELAEEGEVYEIGKANAMEMGDYINWMTPDYPLAHLVEETGFDEATLARWVRAVERKGQAMLYGPPGTGKTYIAEWLAKHLIGGGDGFWELVQFHPAYAYEDFMQGIRPQSDGESLRYPLVPGRFLEFCQKARRREDRCVLVIDEINRANLARVFGELMYLLEYRDREIALAGGGEFFRIPPNVRLIGTMNTADRSIALVDHALRRRFAFLALQPNFDALRRYHRRHQTGFDVKDLIKTLTRLNRQIGDAHYEVGITFFLRRDLAEQIEDVWRMEIEPYLEEYFFDQPDQVDAFRWEKVGREMAA